MNSLVAEKLLDEIESGKAYTPAEKVTTGSGWWSVSGSGSNAESIQEQDLQPQSQPQSLSDRILEALLHEDLSPKRLSQALGQKQRGGHFRDTIVLLRDQGLIEYTLPEKPNSRLQKYRLTSKGRKITRKKQ